MTSRATDLSVLIVNWNTRDLLRQCLNSVLSHSSFSTGQLGLGEGYVADIWVIDNASSDGSADMVAEDFPQVKLIRNKENLGFARANNIGIRNSQGRYLLLLNSDTIMHQQCLLNLLLFMDEHAIAGACSPQLLQADGMPQPYAFGNDPSLPYLIRRGLTSLLAHKHLHNWASEKAQEVDWISGACMMIRRGTIEQVGLLDERFFMYFEDNDLCLRMRYNGWHVFYNPQVTITHLGGQSLRINSRAWKSYQTSLRLFYRKHYSRIANLALACGLWIYNRWDRHMEQGYDG